jgi:hypothetical protein
LTKAGTARSPLGWKRGDDAILIFSVGGGDTERNVSPNLIRAIELVKERSAKCSGGTDSDRRVSFATIYFAVQLKKLVIFENRYDAPSQIQTN